MPPAGELLLRRSGPIQRELAMRPLALDTLPAGADLARDLVRAAVRP